MLDPMRILIALVFVVSCTSKKECKETCDAEFEKAKAACGEVADGAKLGKMTADQQSAHVARIDCQLRAFDDRKACMKECDKK